MTASPRVVIGADTHLDSHHLAVITDTGIGASTRWELEDLTGDSKGRFLLVRLRPELLRDNGIRPMSDWGSSGQLGLWFSCGQFRDQLVDDDADTRSLAARAIPAVEQSAIAQRVVVFFAGAAAWHGHCISDHCSSWGSHGCGVM